MFIIIYINNIFFIQAEIALKSEGFTDIDFHTLQTILNRETLNCKEIVVFQVGKSFIIVSYTRKL